MENKNQKVSIDLLKGVLKETWTSLFRAARTSTIEKVIKFCIFLYSFLNNPNKMLSCV